MKNYIKKQISKFNENEKPIFEFFKWFIYFWASVLLNFFILILLIIVFISIVEMSFLIGVTTSNHNGKIFGLLFISAILIAINLWYHYLLAIEFKKLVIKFKARKKGINSEKELQAVKYEEALNKIKSSNETKKN